MYSSKNKSLQKQKGVTLIALVVTIVVLLILAGVSISMLSGDDGIIINAQKAKEETEKAEEDELRKLTILEAATNIENTEYKDNSTGEEIKVTIPAGYAVSKVEGENAVKDGMVIIDSRGNEYVWIPCTTDEASSELKYQRTEWYVENDGGTRASKDELELTNPDITYTQAELNNGINPEISQEIVNQINAEKASIEKYGGFYIGRYEIGNDNNVAVIKANQVPYNSIKWSQAYSIAKGIGGGKSAETYLCSSYAWDTAINFIQNNGARNYATSVVGFNGNWSTQEVVDKRGNVIKPSGTSQGLNTGITTPQSNIYDMGGNMIEFTTELNIGTSEPVVLRGGHYDSSNPAGRRGDTAASDVRNILGARATLFLK